MVKMGARRFGKEEFLSKGLVLNVHRKTRSSTTEAGEEPNLRFSKRIGKEGVYGLCRENYCLNFKPTTSILILARSSVSVIPSSVTCTRMLSLGPSSRISLPGRTISVRSFTAFP